MVMMQVCAHYQIDFLRPRAGGCKAIKIRNIEHVPERPSGLDLVVAAAGVDQDLLAADLQQPAVDGEPDQSLVSVVVMRRQPRFVFGHVRIGK
ncbi:MAG: hypothetical protein WAL49_04465, partial [Pseudolabrys sp.]